MTEKQFPPGVLVQVEDRGFILTIREEVDKEGDRNCIIARRDGATLREFKYPAYRIYTLAAHFDQMVDEILNFVMP